MEKIDCPLCVEPLGLDEQILPCPCGYQVCMFCWNRVKEEGSGNCPACRVPYADKFDLDRVSKPSTITTTSSNGASNSSSSSAFNRGGMGGRGRGRGRGGVSQVLTKGNKVLASVEQYTPPPPPPPLSQVHSHIHRAIGSSRGGFRGPRVSGAGAPSSSFPQGLSPMIKEITVFQKNMVVLEGLPASLSSEAVLCRREFCGQFSTSSLPKVLISNEKSNNVSSKTRFEKNEKEKEEGKALVWFSNESEARACVIAVDGFYIDGSVIRCCIGSLGYCESLLTNSICETQASSCHKLHSIGSFSDSFTPKEEQFGFNEAGTSFAETKHPNLHFKNANGVTGGKGQQGLISSSERSHSKGIPFAFPSVPSHLVGFARGTVPLPRGLSLQRPESTGVTSNEADNVVAVQEECLTAANSPTSSIFRKRDKKLGYSQAASKLPMASKPPVPSTSSIASVLPTRPFKPVTAPQRNDLIPQSTESTSLQHKTYPACISSKSKKSVVLNSAEKMTETSLSPEDAYSEINEASSSSSSSSSSFSQQQVNAVQRSKRGKRCGKSSSSCATTAASVSGSGES
jgi:hypothetical protein